MKGNAIEARRLNKKIPPNVKKEDCLICVNEIFLKEEIQ
jgi:hypothetical protein